jgi:hypothetical protein
MDAIPSPRARNIAQSAAAILIATAALILVRPAAAVDPPLVDMPVVWYADDQRDIEKPRERAPHPVPDFVYTSFFRAARRATHPGRLMRRAFNGDPAGEAVNVNALDEVPNSSWFTNRIGLFPMTPEEVERGPGTGIGPDLNKPWTVVYGKVGGVSPGFQIVDSKGDRYIIKFDAAGFPCMMTAPGVITSRLLHAAGYNVTADYIVTFRREDLRVKEGIAFTKSDLDAVLGFVERMEDGSWRALASRLLGGDNIGPFDWKGRRSDDPNDRIKHEDRRELRGFRVFAAWLKHHDTKQNNTLDMYVEEGGRRFVRHYFIDFASTLGTGARAPHAKQGFEYGVDFMPVMTRTFTLGFYESKWRRLRRVEGLPECGYFEDDLFDPYEFKPLSPNEAFANMTDRDAYWAAKIIIAFRDEHLRAAVEAGQYQDSRSADYIVDMLAARRDIIAREVFGRVPPLDFFSLRGEVASFHDLGVEYDIYDPATTRYRFRCTPLDALRSGPSWSQWVESTSATVDLTADPLAATFAPAPPSRFPFCAIECQVSRGGDWSSSVLVYASRRSGRVVALER